MEGDDRWSTPRLAEFVAAVTSAPDETSATRRAVEWATEALEAEVGVIFEGHEVLASVGFPRGEERTGPLLAALSCGADVVVVPGIGVCRLASTQRDVNATVSLVVARGGADTFSGEEVGLLRAASRSLTTTLRLFRALSAERVMRGDLQQRQALLERLADIQRSITRRVPLADVLDSVTRGARDLLDVEVAAVRLIDPEAPDEMVMASHIGLPADVAVSMRRTRVGHGAGGRAVAEARLVIVEDYGSADDAIPALAGQQLVRAMAAPVRDGDRVTGSIVVATKRADLRFGHLEQEMLTAFAEHASLALIDAARVEHIQLLAFHDELTGLPNRGLFIERLEQSLIRARRLEAHTAVLFLDLDRFKTINDSLGHTAGDRLLVAIGERLRNCLRNEDTAARLGGDEFAILAHCDRDGAAEIAQRVLTAMEPAVMIDEREVWASASIGIALDLGGELSAGRMLRDADIAMYRAKLGGTDAYVVFEPAMHAAALQRIDLEADLRRAVMRDQMRLDYQPIVRLSDQHIIGMEALIRWQHEERGLMSPLDFIPLAEQTGQIVALGRWTMAEACRQARRWHQQSESLQHLLVAVNVSPRQLQDHHFVRDVADVLARAGLDPGHMVLEITEGAVMVDVEVAIRRLGALRELGVSLAVDDFGTGHSSLALLRRLPVDIIKIDKLFVDTITTDSTSAAMLETIVRMGAILSLRVVVEGIETAAQAALVATFGEVLGQGFHLARPQGVTATDKLLAHRVATEPASGGGGHSNQRSPRVVALPAPCGGDHVTPVAG